MNDPQKYQFTPHHLYDEYRERRVKARVQTLPEAGDTNPPKRIRPCDLQKLRKACGIDGIPTECFGTFQEDHSYT
jgi:hypothetical protein